MAAMVCIFARISTPLWPSFSVLLCGTLTTTWQVFKIDVVRHREEKEVLLVHIYKCTVRPCVHGHLAQEGSNHNLFPNGYSLKAQYLRLGGGK